MILGTWPVNTPMWDGDLLAGPAPILFSEDPEAAVEAIEADSARAHYDLNRYNILKSGEFIFFTN